MKKKVIFLIIALCVVGGLVGYYAMPKKSEQFVPYDTILATLGKETSYAVLDMTYGEQKKKRDILYISKDADRKGDLIVSNKVFVILGKNNEDYRKVVAFWNFSETLTDSLKKMIGIWRLVDTTLSTTDTTGAKIERLVNLQTQYRAKGSNIPGGRNYVVWWFAYNGVITFDGFDANGGQLREFYDSDLEHEPYTLKGWNHGLVYEKMENWHE